MEPGNAFRSLEAEQPPRVFYDGYSGRPVIPLTLPLHVERPYVVEDLLRLVLEIADLVATVPVTRNSLSALELPLQDEGS